MSRSLFARALRARVTICWGVLIGLGTVPAPAQNAGEPVSREEYDALLRQVAELQLKFGDESGSVAGTDARLPGGKSGLYDKPFLDRFDSSVQLGGYFDVEFRDTKGSRHEFDFHRLIPFLYGNVGERVRFATEIEIEHGEEVAVEFAYLDFLIHEKINFRGGVILSPLGKFNLIHDSPINDLTDRPLVSRRVIPSTMREVGVGIFGTLTEPDCDWEVKYEIYATSGFKGLDDTGATSMSSSGGLRSARASGDGLGTSKYDDINNTFSGVGRLSVSPVIGTEFGLSAHSGDYDESGENNMTVSAVDGLVTLPQLDLAGIPLGPIEFQGEAAYASIERNTFAKTSGVPDDMWGYYLQMNYHFMPQWLLDHVTVLFPSTSTFTFVVRWDEIDLDGDERKRLTFGLNYRPIEEAVIKFDYQFNDGSGTAAASHDDDAFLVSLTSYF